MAEAWLIYRPETDRLYYQIGDKAYDASSLRQIPLPRSFGVSILRIRGDQNWVHQPVFIRTTQNWSVEDATDDHRFGVIAQSSPNMINEPVVSFQVFEIPNLTHANIHADGSESLEPIQYERAFSPFLAGVLEYLRDHQLPMLYDVRNRALIARSLMEQA